jgi:hypothetical protein
MIRVFIQQGHTPRFLLSNSIFINKEQAPVSLQQYLSAKRRAWNQFDLIPTESLRKHLFDSIVAIKIQQEKAIKKTKWFLQFN